MKDKTVLELATRLNEIEKERNSIDIRLLELNKEYNDIVYELWDRIPNLKEDVDMQPKKMVKKKEVGE